MESSLAPSSQPACEAGAMSAAKAPRQTMKAIVHTGYGLDGVELREVDRPALEDHQVLVRVHASSVNPAEWYRVMGPIFGRVSSGLRTPKNPAIGTDVAGRVEAVGKDVKEFQPGDEVFGAATGAWAEYARSRERSLVRKPANVSFEEAGSVLIAGMTAIQALRTKGQIQPGQKVLINGASGGVGTFAVQLAKAFGADVTAVCSTRNVDLVRSLGADRVVDYTQDDFTRLGERHDLMLDIAGSRPFRQFKRVLTPNATVVLVGGRMSTKVLGPMPHVFGTLGASVVRSQRATFFIAKTDKADLELLRDLMEEGKVKPVIDRRYELAEAREALRYLGTTHARGKVAITVPGYA